MTGPGEARPLTARRSGPLGGEAQAPSDKSISHRALIFGAMALGETRIEALLEGEDVLATAAALRALGARIERLGPGSWTVSGVGVGGFLEAEDVIDCGNSGTGARLLMGAAATTPITTFFTGDASLRKRPMKRVLDPLALFGARAEARSRGRLPLALIGAADPVPVEYALPVASAQVKSAVLLAGLNAPGETRVIEPTPTRDHTERMLEGFGAEVAGEPRPEGGRLIRLAGRPELRAQTVTVARDPSSAAFAIAAAALVEGSEIVAPGVGLNPTRSGFYATLQDMGADLAIENERVEGGERVADLRVRRSELKGVAVPPERAPRMIDEYPILSVCAAFASGETVMRGAEELRVKETDRIAAMVKGLRDCGVDVEELPDGMVVKGRGPGGVPGGATIAAELDHRIAMSFAVLGLAAREPVEIDDARPIATSFPNFVELMRGLGAGEALYGPGAEPPREA